MGLLCCDTNIYLEIVYFFSLFQFPDSGLKKFLVSFATHEFSGILVQLIVW